MNVKSDDPKHDALSRKRLKSYGEIEVTGFH